MIFIDDQVPDMEQLMEVKDSCLDVFHTLANDLAGKNVGVELSTRAVKLAIVLALVRRDRLRGRSVPGWLPDAGAPEGLVIEPDFLCPCGCGASACTTRPETRGSGVFGIVQILQFPIVENEGIRRVYKETGCAE